MSPQQADYKGMADKVALAMLDAERMAQGAGYAGMVITGMNIRFPGDSQGDTLVIVKGYDQEGQACVAFHGAWSFAEAVGGAIARVKNGTMKWKIDEFAR